MDQVLYILDSGKIGTTNRIARRREQNRINQRARRLRKRIQNPQKLDNVDSGSDTCTYGVLVPSKRCPQHNNTTTYPMTQFDHATITPVLSIQLPNYISLTQLNVWEAIIINSLFLGISHFFTGDWGHNSNAADTVDPSCTPHYLSSSYPSMSASSSLSKTKTTTGNIPTSLMPTYLQQTTPHFPWIDLIPSAGMRDDLIRAGSRIDVHEFCIDMMGAIFGTLNNSNNSNNHDDGSLSNGIRVWGDSWLVESWEMTDGFVRKWGWLLDDGCQEMVRATNRWREERGEDMIII